MFDIRKTFRLFSLKIVSAISRRKVLLTFHQTEKSFILEPNREFSDCSASKNFVGHNCGESSQTQQVIKSDN